MTRPGSIRGNVARTSGNIDTLVFEVRQLVAVIREALEEAKKRGINVNPTVGETEIPIGVNVSLPEEDKT